MICYTPSGIQEFLIKSQIFQKRFFGLFSKNLPAAQKFWSKRGLYNDSYNLIIFHELKGYSRKMKIKFNNVMESNESSPFKKKILKLYFYNNSAKNIKKDDVLRKGIRRKIN